MYTATLPSPSSLMHSTLKVSTGRPDCTSEVLLGLKKRDLGTRQKAQSTAATASPLHIGYFPRGLVWTELHQYKFTRTRPMVEKLWPSRVSERYPDTELASGPGASSHLLSALLAGFLNLLSRQMCSRYSRKHECIHHGWITSQKHQDVHPPQ